MMHQIRKKENDSKKSFTSSIDVKMHTYLYETVSDNNSIMVCPNSCDSPKLHRIHLMMKNMQIAMLYTKIPMAQFLLFYRRLFFVLLFY